MLRTIKRWFSTSETQALSRDLDQLQEQFLTFGHRLEGMQLRVDRHLNKLHMRDARARRPDLNEEDQAIIDDLWRRGALQDPRGEPVRGDPFGDR